MLISRIGVVDDSSEEVAILNPLLVVVLSVGVRGLTLFEATITATLSFVQCLKNAQLQQFTLRHRTVFLMSFLKEHAKAWTFLSVRVIVGVHSVLPKLWVCKAATCPLLSKPADCFHVEFTNCLFGFDFSLGLTAGSSS